MDYYWVIEQAEYATDVMFRDRATLQPLYEQLLRHATLCFSAEDVMTFLGRKLHGGFQGEVQSDFTKRWPGARIKHRMKNNGIKMYDKFGCVLRVETVINRPSEFQVRRRGRRQRKIVLGWFPMAKGVANFYRYAEVSRAANARYLEALAGVADPAAARRQIRKLARPAVQGNRRYRGFNPAAEEDVRLFAAILRGEHTIRGFRNHDIRGQLFPGSYRPEEIRRLANRVSRLLRRLRAHGLIAKIPRSRRWRPTRYGQALMATVLTLHHDRYPQTLLQQAA
jgi:ribosomal protein S6E (S10)